MKNVLFFGNGINRIDSNNLDWNALLDNRYTFSDNTPNTLRYEDCVIDKYRYEISSRNQGSIEFRHKMLIAEKMKDFSSNDIYRRFISIPIVDYITTNYDHSFEMALEEIGYTSQEYDNSESRFSIHRYSCYKNGNGDVKRIWHIHGDYMQPRSIILGYEQYGGQLRKIGEYLNGSYKIGKDQICSIKERIKEPIDVKSWIDLFFDSNIHFVGFGLPFDEMDIWWLLCKRQKLKLQHPNLPIDNQIFYHTKVGNADMYELDKKHLLQTLSVEYKEYNLDDYKELYLKICDTIQ